MSLVTANNVGSPGKGGWKVTTMGRIVRNIRMRPERVLVLARDLQQAGKMSHKKHKLGVNKRARERREKKPVVRTRRKTIDMIAWGSVHLKGVFLDVEGGRSGIDEQRMEVDSGNGNDASEGEDGVKEALPSTRLLSQPIAPASSISTPLQDPYTSLLLEKSNSLNLLKSLFGDDEWVGKERIPDSDVDEERGESEDVEMGVDAKNQSEEVDAQMEEEDDSGNETANEDLPPEPEMRLGPDLPSQRQTTQAKKLKDLFAPQEEGPFSLFLLSYKLIFHLSFL
jgi:hypothetical protein